MVFIPGNHDLCINPGVAPDNHLARRWARQGDCAKWFRRWDPQLVGNQDVPWESFYPHFITNLNLRQEPTPVSVVLLDSCRYRSRQVLSNAIGSHGSSQLRVLKQKLLHLSGPLIVITHHHVAKPANELWKLADRLQSPFKISLDGRELLELLAAYASRTGSDVLLLHGHQHREAFLEYTSASGGVVKIYGHPSSTMGNEKGGQLDGTLRYAVVYVSESGRLTVQSHSINDELPCEIMDEDACSGQNKHKSLP